MRTAQDAAVDLLNAVDEALNIFTVQAQQANASMETAMASRDRLMSFLAAFQPGDHDSGRPQPSTKPADPAVGGLSAEERFAESSARSKKWVTAQSEIWIALMRLYPYPEARDELERLAQRMLLIQALQVAEPIPGPRYVPPTFDLSTSLVEKENARRKGAEWATHFMQHMDERMATSARHFEEHFNRIRTLLEEIRAGAASICALLNPQTH